MSLKVFPGDKLQAHRDECKGHPPECKREGGGPDMSLLKAQECSLEAGMLSRKFYNLRDEPKCDMAGEYFNWSV